MLRLLPVAALAIPGIAGGGMQAMAAEGQAGPGAQVEVPAGKYIVGPTTDQKSIDLGAFEIDKYEVTIGEYAAFIEFCQASPENEHQYDLPGESQHLEHANADVLALIGNAKRGTNIFIGDADPGVKVDFHCPMVAVTYYDAYAYAHWKGRDLPTEEEWEAAARGPKGNKYPWGDDLDLKRFNSNESYQPVRPGATVPDGYNYWSPVDAFGKDESPLKVVGMAGNVAEWTYREQGAQQTPVVKGGSFATPPIALYEQLATLAGEDARYVLPVSAKPKNKPAPPGFLFVTDPITPTTKTLYIGFRTVKRK